MEQYLKWSEFMVRKLLALAVVVSFLFVLLIRGFAEFTFVFILFIGCSINVADISA